MKVFQLNAVAAKELNRYTDVDDTNGMKSNE
jgi:hypothetical protein